MTGAVHVITGPMFSGKSEELVRRLRRQTIARRTVVAFHSAVDTRGTPGLIESRVGIQHPARVVRDASHLRQLAQSFSVVGIDEAQFFDDDLVRVVVELADSGVIVYVSGLDRYADGTPWAPMPALLAVADTVDKQAAVCVVCCAPATHTHDKTGGSARVEVGSEQYEARCRVCWLAGLSQKE